tara:strand:- start:46 stop:471 length:426 start_codon:yes stop_codon:yes gene_type:complete
MKINKLDWLQIWEWNPNMQEYKAIGLKDLNSLSSEMIDKIEVNDLVDVFLKPNIDVEKKTFLNNKNVEIYHSGGGCVHYYYKGFLIDSQSHEILHQVEKYSLDTECYFGYWDGEKQFGFSATLKDGVELLEMLDFKKLEEF